MLEAIERGIKFPEKLSAYLDSRDYHSLMDLWQYGFDLAPKDYRKKYNKDLIYVFKCARFRPIPKDQIPERIRNRYRHKNGNMLFEKLVFEDPEMPKRFDDKQIRLYLKNARGRIDVHKIASDLLGLQIDKITDGTTYRFTMTCIRMFKMAGWVRLSTTARHGDREYPQFARRGGAFDIQDAFRDVLG